MRALKQTEGDTRVMQVDYYRGAIVSIPSGEHEILALFHHGDPVPGHRGDVALLRLHGLMGNLLDETEAYLSQILAGHGFSSMTINTLLANLGVFYGFGIFDNAMAQIETACAHLRGLGFRKVVLAGHGLGGCMAVRYGAQAHPSGSDGAVDAVVAISTPYSLPEMTRRRWEHFGSDPTYEAVCTRVAGMEASEPGSEEAQDRTFVVRRAHGPTNAPQHSEIFTLRTWAALAGPDADCAMPHKHIGQINAPLLLVCGTDDDRVLPGECASLAQTARDGGNPDVNEVELSTDHTFTGMHDELGRIIAEWLNERFDIGSTEPQT